MSDQEATCRIEKSRCNTCGLCIEACPCHAVEMGEKGLVFHCPDHCVPLCHQGYKGCGCICEEICPTGALTCSFAIVAG